MKKGQEHPSTKVYQDFIVQAYLKLLQSKSAGDITITEICAQADISRRTFYRHFENKEGIIECYANELMKTLCDLQTQAYFQNDNYLFAKSYYEFFLARKDIYKCLIDNGYQEIMFMSYIKSMIPLYFAPRQEAEEVPDIFHATECKMSYKLGGLWSLLTYWFSTGCMQTPKELAELIG